VRLGEAGLDDLASQNLVQYLKEQKAATEIVPDDRTIVVERFRDELGDWRVCIHTPFGARLHAPWAQAIEARIRDELGMAVQCMYTDDGIVVRVPEADEAPAVRFVVFEPDEIEEIVTNEVGGSALFASRFRECAARALLLPRRRPGQRTPLWQQRQRSAQLLQAAGKYGSFPVILETFRECLQDVFDLPALTELMAKIRSREVRIVEVETPMPSPFASSLQFSYVAAFMYEGDVPLAERRAQALSLDRSLLAEIMGHQELRELIDEQALADLELDLQLLSDERKVREADGLHDALRRLGDLSIQEVWARVIDPASAEPWLEELGVSHRALLVRISGRERWIAIEDASRYRDALGVALPVGVPGSFLEPVDDPLGDLVARFARTHGPFAASEPAQRFELAPAVVEEVLRRLERDGRVVEGEFRPDGVGREWVDVDVLRRLRRRSLAAFRKEVEPVGHEVLTRFLLAWQGLGPSSVRRANEESLYRVIEQLQGVPVPASVLESQILPARLPGYSPGLLDQLGASGDVVWCGNGALGSDDGWVCLSLAENAELLLPPSLEVDLSEGAKKISEVLAGGGAMFFRQIAEATDSTDDLELLLALWELVWSGRVTNDTFQSLRAALGGIRRTRPRAPRGRARRPSFPARTGPPAGAGRWSLVPDRDVNTTRRLHATTERLLERYGVVTRGAVSAERVPGGFAAVYPVLSALEDADRCRRGHFVEGLGGAQFALSGAVDRMRALSDTSSSERNTLVVAATDPANPYGAALPWPDRDQGGGHRPGRKAGAVVVLVNGHLVFYVEKGGRRLLSYSDDDEHVRPGVDALALAAREGVLGRISVEKADGEDVLDAPIADVLMQAGFRPTSRGLRPRS
jgi:ATP-dependent Lhr-like helicase